MNTNINIEGGSGACERCAQHFSTCCVIDPDGAEACFPLSVKEQENLKLFMHQHQLSYGMVEQANTPLFVESMCKLFRREITQVQELFPNEQSHMRLEINSEGACVFLSEHGCVLPRKLRPLYCRLFPFWFDQGELTYFLLADCQAQLEQKVRFGLSLRKPLLECFSLTKDKAFDLYEQIRQGWGLSKEK